MDNLITKLTTEVNGVPVTYGRIPSGVIKGWDEIVFYFQCSSELDAEKHKSIIRPLIEQLEAQSYDHGSEWRFKKAEAFVWTPFCQISLVQFRIRDSY